MTGRNQLGVLRGFTLHCLLLGRLLNQAPYIYLQVAGFRRMLQLAFHAKLMALCLHRISLQAGKQRRFPLDDSVMKVKVPRRESLDPSPIMSLSLSRVSCQACQAL